MNRTAYRIIALCVFLFIIIVFTAGTCVLVKNEENYNYSLNVVNDSTVTIRMIIWGVKQSPLESGASGVYYVSPGAGIDAAYESSPELWFNIRGTDQFPFIMPSTGVRLSIGNADIGLPADSER
ncbi:MAG TPA: hypothetical protein PLO84_02840 [Thermotogota bacterium]|nr:hypothetical protein [Thermotogota bacterium]HPJ88035.1 hypothetical protein [Thermotogota bacterium]